MANIITRNIPNSITCCNLICGCIATSWALSGNYKLALVFIISGAIFDFFDGMSARLLHVSSEIGKELDSLADVVTFGVAPASMVYTLLHALSYGYGVLATMVALRGISDSSFLGASTGKIQSRHTPDHLIYWSSHPSQCLVLGVTHRGCRK